VRLRAAGMFEHKERAEQIAARLRAGTKSVYQWRRRWLAGGAAALASRGPGGAVCRLDDAQLARLVAELDRGPAAHGWDEDQRWTLARAAVVIERLFGVSYTLRGTCYLLHRIGWTPQVPAVRAVERDEDAIAAWRALTWAKARG
jgi:transposase